MTKAGTSTFERKSFRNAKRRSAIFVVGALAITGLYSGSAWAVTADEEDSDPVNVQDITVSDLELAPAILESAATEESENDTEDLTRYRLVAHVPLDADVLIAGLSWANNEELDPIVSYRLHDEDQGWEPWTPWGTAEAGVDSDPSALQGLDELLITGSDILEVAVENIDPAQRDELTLHVIDPAQGSDVENEALTDWKQAQDTAEGADIAQFSLLLPAETTDVVVGDDEDAEDDEFGRSGAAAVDEDSSLQDGSEDASETGETGELPLTESPELEISPYSLTTTGIYDTGFQGLKITTRAGWKANESWRDWDNDPITVKGAVIHHTAGSNNYTKDQVPDVIRGIYYYHARTLGWGDIGYHLLVDKYGGVWQGRYGSLLRTNEGAHAYGANASTFGVSVLGDYMNAAPSQKALDSVAKVTAWKLSVNGITSATGKISIPGSDGRGRTVYTVSGHRDVGATDCPGNAFYSRMGSLRKQINDYIKDNKDVPQVLPVKARRIQGATRVETAAALSKELYPDGASEVYLVNQKTFVDALSAGMMKSGPILFVDKGSIPKATSAALSRLKPDRVYVIGGSASISDSVLKTATANGAVGTRLGGANRSETAIKIANKQFGNRKAPVYFADGYGQDSKGSPDAVAGGNLSDGPVLITKVGDGLEAANKAEVKKREGKVTELGGASLGTGTSARLGGKDRFETSLVIAKHAYGTAADVVYLANGRNYADALAAGVISDAPRVLVNSDTISDSICKYLGQVHPAEIVVLGGVQSVSDSVKDRAMECATF